MALANEPFACVSVLDKTEHAPGGDFPDQSANIWIPSLLPPPVFMPL